ncbi:MAG: SIR2 family protein [Alphaproteobacteria bacterium]|nr:SIR2 family protein [Alphaproteobacteria bacterium]
MSTLRKILENTLAGKRSTHSKSSHRAVLFCGAGFSANCLSLYTDDEFGSSNTLLEKLNSQLQHKFTNLKNASEKYIKEFGEHGLLKLLQENYTVSRVTHDMIDIVRFPWNAIYTTNYDNAIELALQKADKHPFPVNNIAYDETVITSLKNNQTPVIYLHGSLSKFDEKNLESSLVITTGNYHSVASKHQKLFAHLKQDFNRSDAFVFVGYKLNDFHLQEVFYSPAETKNKTFFINTL